jgi:hypothetical protein
VIRSGASAGASDAARAAAENEKNTTNDAIHALSLIARERAVPP